MKVYNVVNKDGTAFYSSGYGSRYEAEELLKISKQHDLDAHVVEYEVKTESEKMAEEREELLARIPRWISVEEKLPELGVYVAVHYGKFHGNLAGVMMWDGDHWIMCDGFQEQDGVITHWMPLPEPPKEEHK